MFEFIAATFGLLIVTLGLVLLIGFPVWVLTTLQQLLSRQREVLDLLSRMGTELLTQREMIRGLVPNDTSVPQTVSTESFPTTRSPISDVVERTLASENQEAAAIEPPRVELPVKEPWSREPEEIVDAITLDSDVVPPKVDSLAQPASSEMIATIAAEAPEVRAESSAIKALKRIGSWLVVGEEDRPEGVSLEFAIASTWLLRLGVLILVMAIGFFLKYSIDNGLLPPIGRVAIAIFVGCSMIVAGLRMLGAKYHAFAQGLVGGGLATLFFAIYAAHSFYSLIDTIPAFALMVCVTAGAVGMAVGFNSLLIAMLGLLGGYATPLMLGSNEVNFVGLLGYLTVLGYGTLSISYWREWRLMTLAAFAGTYTVFLLALRAYTSENFFEVMPFAIAFFLLFAYSSFLFHIRKGLKATVLEVLALIVNAAFFFAIAYRLVEQRYGELAVSAVTISLALFYLFNTLVFLHRERIDRNLLSTFIGSSAFFAAVTLPLMLTGQWLTVSWSVLALVMLWISVKIESSWLRQISLALYAIVGVRLLVLDLPGQYLPSMANDASVSMEAFWLAVGERVIAFGVPIAAFALGVKTLGSSVGRYVVDRANDSFELIERRPSVAGLAGVAIVIGLIAAHLELVRVSSYAFPIFQPVMLTGLWAAAGAVLIAFALLRWPKLSELRISVAVIGFVIVALRLMVFDVGSWVEPGFLRFAGPWLALSALVRLIDFGLVIGLAVFIFTRFSAGVSNEQFARRFFLAAALGFTWIFLTFETGTILHTFVPGMRHGGISVLWAMFALALLVGGISNRLAEVRYSGLFLFSVVVAKVFLLDLARLDAFYRIVAFLMLGVLVMAGSFIYLTFRSRFAISPPTDASEGTRNRDGLSEESTHEQGA